MSSAARQDREAPAFAARLQRQLGVGGRDVARLAFEIGAEIDDGVTCIAGHLDRRIQ